MKFLLSNAKKCLLLLSSAVAVIPTMAQTLPGAGRAMSCDNTSPQAFNLGSAINDSLAFNNFTIEMWVKADPASVAGNPPIIANKNYTSGGNTGFCWTYSASSSGPGAGQTAGSFRFNFRANQGTRRDYDIKPANPHQWNHIAMVVDRKGILRGYVNGVYQPSIYSHPATIAADSSRSLALGALNLYLAQDGTGAYPSGFFFKGSMDEVRIWKKALDSTEIRNNMCRKLSGNEAGLLAYYRLDELPGSTTILNSASATAGQFNGAATTTAPSFVSSGAPVGDQSTFLYTNNWATQSLMLNTTTRGNFIVDSFGTSMGNFLHLYQVDAAPDSTNGLTAFGNNDVVFGVFAPADSVHYYPKFEYSNYTQAVSFANTLQFFTRRSGDVLPWVGKNNLYNDATSYVLRADSVQGTRQFFLANFVGTCDDPSALTAGNVQATSAEISWTTGGSGMWNIQYGPAGFSLGSGTSILAVNTTNYTLSNLQDNTNYEVYVQDTCTGIGSSNWIGPVAFTTDISYAAYASGYALQFNGNGVTNGPSYGVNLGTALKDSLAHTNFSIEMWVKVGMTNTNNPSLIANKDYVNGGNTGISWNYAAPGNSFGSAPGNTFRFNLTPQGGTRHDYDVPVSNEYSWNHVAVTVDRKGMIKCYLNGVYVPNNFSGSTSSQDIAADSSRSLAGSLPYYLGTDGTGNYRSPFNGQLDEVRIWKKVLTENELRAAMCHKLQGAEPDLLAYYPMNEPSGNIVHNNATVTTGMFNGQLTPNAPLQVISGAPIGDTSIFVYPGNGWTGVSLSLADAGQGSLSVDSVMNNGIPVPGIHIYKVDGIPNFTNGIADIGTTDKFFGVFTANDVNAGYKVSYDHSNYNNAVNNAADLHLYNRRHNAMQTWAQLPAINDLANNTITVNSSLGTRQYILANFSPAVCAGPQGIILDSFNNSYAALSWTSAANSHNTKFGLSGFDLDTAASVSTMNNIREISNLDPNTSYDFYVQDSCNGTVSAWVGPVTFTTDGECPAAVNVFADSVSNTSLVLKWTDQGTLTSSYGISWGEQGTFSNPDSGTYQFGFTTRHLFSDLEPNTTYDFYIKSFCNSAVDPNSGWHGPYSFTTANSTSAGTISERHNKVNVYPNPANDHIDIELMANNTANIRSVAVFNSIGSRITQDMGMAAPRIRMSTKNYVDGIYHLVIKTDDNETIQQTIVIKH